jgi:phosphatidylinositol alpha-1,6-mannosyltransferase
MNILIVGPDFKPLAGGVAEYTHRLALYLHNAGDKVTVLSEKMENAESFDKVCPYRIYRYDLRFLSKGRIGKYYAAYKWLKDFIDTHRPLDIIISNCHEISSIVASAVCKSLDIPFSIFTHGSEINRKEIKEKFKIKYVLRNSDVVFCNSTFTQKLAMSFGVPQSRTAVVPGGISIDEFDISRSLSRSPLGLNLEVAGKKVIFTCGRLVERKGHDMVIRALPRVLQKVGDAIYLIAGEGPHRQRLMKLANEYKVNNHVIFAGRVSNNERQALYASSDVFAMPCRELKNGRVEGFGLVFLEANAFCKPVVAGRSGGVIDAVEHAKTGFMVNPLDVNEIADSIIYLLMHPDTARQMGEYGRKRIEREFTWDISGAKLRQVLLSTCARKP